MMREEDRLRALEVRVAREEGVSWWRRASFTSARCRRASAASMASHSARSQRRRSSATWSLRLRPVCSFPPSGPISSVSRRSDGHVECPRRRLEREAPAIELAAHRREAALEARALGARQQAGTRRARARVPAARDVVSVEDAVDGREVVNASTSGAVFPANRPAHAFRMPAPERARAFLIAGRGPGRRGP
jgi:hypothetical protein